VKYDVVVGCRVYYQLPLAHNCHIVAISKLPTTCNRTVNQFNQSIITFIVSLKKYAKNLTANTNTTNTDTTGTGKSS